MTEDAERIDQYLYPTTNIAQWIKPNIAKITAAHNLHGGWEVWTQVEIALMLRGLGLLWNVEREQAVYVTIGPREKTIDIWFTPNDPTNQKPMGIEFKCRRVGESSDTFKGRLAADVIKIVDGLKNNYKPANVYAIGLSPDVADTQALPSTVRKNNGVDHPVKWWYIDVVDAASGLSFYIVWAFEEVQ